MGYLNKGLHWAGCQTLIPVIKHRLAPPQEVPEHMEIVSFSATESQKLKARLPEKSNCCKPRRCENCWIHTGTSTRTPLCPSLSVLIFSGACVIFAYHEGQEEKKGARNEKGQWSDAKEIFCTHSFTSTLMLSKVKNSIYPDICKVNSKVHKEFKIVQFGALSQVTDQPLRNVWLL